MFQTRTGWNVSLVPRIVLAMLIMIWAARIAGAQQTDEGGGPEPPADQDASLAGDESSDDAENGASESESTIPSLDEMLRGAFQHNPDIRAARAEVAVAEAKLERTRLTVVKELTAYRGRWHSAKASLAAAQEELARLEEIAGRGLVAKPTILEAEYRVSHLQLQLRELETELPFLLGRPLDNNLERSDSQSLEDRRTRIEDEAIPLAEQILTLSLQSLQTGERDNTQQCVTWSARLMQLQREIAESDAQRKSAVEDHLARLQELLKITGARYRAAEAPAEDVWIVEFALIEAELMLLEGAADNTAERR